MARILITDGMDKSAADSLRKMGHDLTEKFFELEDLKTQIKKFDAIIVRSATKIRKDVIDAALETNMLKLIIRAGVGVDNIDVDYAQQNGITVANTPSASSASVAELAIGHMFTLARHIHIANVTMRDGQWNKKQYKGIELAGKTLGLVGFGRIAKETAKIASALGMRVMYTNRSGAKFGYDQYQYAPLNDILAKSDFVSLHIPFDPSHGAVISQEQFDMMKDSAYLINCARGGVVDEYALIAALDAGKLAGAAVDVFAEEPTANQVMCSHPKVSVTPHVGGSTKEAQMRIGEELVSIVKKNFNEQQNKKAV
jgi:D-3-phosphoglycerate dehydrogenase / 2-oxoglutarate reductase